MWFFCKKTTIAASGILQGAADHHSHILPGVDDGVETMDEALHILATYEALGIKHLWLTPHIMEDIPNTAQKLSARFEELKAAYTGKITLHLAAEYMIDNHLRKLLQPLEDISQKSSSPSLPKNEHTKGEEDKAPTLLAIGTASKHILVETSYYNAPIRMNETLQQIKSLGYHPLLAHPERYMYLCNAEYTKLHSEGIHFQLNLASLAGGYGPEAKKRAQWLLANGLYSVAGTDLHCEEAIELITNCKLSEKEIEQVERLLQNKF